MNTIIHMNHSEKWQQEPESAPLPADRDLADLHKRLTALVGSVEAVTFGLSLAGKSYDTKCREYLYAIAVIVAERGDYKPNSNDSEMTVPTPSRRAQSHAAGYGDFGPM